MSTKPDARIKLPLQLASLIQGEAANLLLDEEDSAAVLAAGGDDSIIVDAGGEDAVMMLDASSSEAAAAVVAGTAATKTPKTLNAIVHAAQVRHVKELQSYVRAVCMRMGFSD